MTYRLRQQYPTAYKVTSGYALPIGGAAPAPVDLLSSLAYYWPMDDATGTTAVDVHAGNTLPYFQGVTSTGTAKVGTALSFPSGASGVETPTGPAAGPFTIAGWIDSDPSGPIVTIRRSFTLYRFEYSLGELILSGNGSTDSMGVLPAGYNHLAMAWDGADSLKGYLNGALVAEVIPVDPLAGSPLRIFINPPVDGMVDEWGFWTAELGLAQIQALYNGGNGLGYADLT